ncbi:MAG: flagellar hook capping FlgD N-terminal domain-containing protein [Dehalobacterium sp.]
MYISGIPAVDATLNNVTNSNSALDKDAFLRLLTVQLQNQDPSSPQDSDQFMAQMTNFAILEQLQEINTNLSYFFDTEKQFQTIQMLGREIMVTDSEGNEAQGVAESLIFSAEGPKLKVNGNEYFLSQVQEIKITENENE